MIMRGTRLCTAYSSYCLPICVEHQIGIIDSNSSCDDVACNCVDCGHRFDFPYLPCTKYTHTHINKYTSTLTHHIHKYTNKNEKKAKTTQSHVNCCRRSSFAFRIEEKINITFTINRTTNHTQTRTRTRQISNANIPNICVFFCSLFTEPALANGLNPLRLPI